MSTISDSAGKAVLKTFPRTTSELLNAPSGKKWVRCCPKYGISPMPYITKVGSTTRTNPDGMFALLHPERDVADIIVFDVSDQRANIGDKRSRYGPTNSGRNLVIPISWLVEEIYDNPISRKPRWRYFGTFQIEPSDDLTFSVGYLRAVFVVPDDFFNKRRLAEDAEPHEYFVPNSKFKDRLMWTSNFREFAKGFTPNAHFYGG